jgi:hypothetical protein
MSSRKKVLSKKETTKEVVQSSGCPTCGCCCGNQGMIGSALAVIFGGLVVALSFFLLQTML